MGECRCATQNDSGSGVIVALEFSALNCGELSSHRIWPPVVDGLPSVPGQCR